MAAAKNSAGALGTSPLRPVTVQGVEVHVDDSKAASWKAFKMVGVISDPDAAVTAKMQAMFDLIGYVTDTDEDEIVERCGGDDASVQNVMEFATALVAEAVPKN